MENVTCLLHVSLLSLVQNGNWADRSCGEKHGYVCMKISDTESTGEEVPMDLGCKPVSGFIIYEWSQMESLFIRYYISLHRNIRRP